MIAQNPFSSLCRAKSGAPAVGNAEFVPVVVFVAADAIREFFLNRRQARYVGREPLRQTGSVQAVHQAGFSCVAVAEPLDAFGELVCLVSLRGGVL